MIKHEYKVDGQTSTGEWFTGTCVSDDIIEAIRLFIKEGYSVHSIERGEQVNADAKMQILSTNIIGGTYDRSVFRQ